MGVIGSSDHGVYSDCLWVDAMEPIPVPHRRPRLVHRWSALERQGNHADTRRRFGSDDGGYEQRVAPHSASVRIDNQNRLPRPSQF